MKNNIIYGSAFLVITVVSIFLFYQMYDANYVNFDLNDIDITVDKEYWTNGDVKVTVAYAGDIKVSEYSFDGGRTWQKENVYTVKENKKLNVVLKSKGKESVHIPFRISNVDKELPSIKSEDKIYTALNSEFDLSDYFVVEDNLSGVMSIKTEGEDKIDVSTLGEYEVEVEATDIAGNVGFKTVTVAVVSKNDKNLPENQNNKVSVIGLSVDKTKVNLVKGTTTKITPTVKPANATNKKVNWTSINTSIAKVNSSGVITAVGAGSTTVKATTADGEKVSEINVVVTDQAIEVVSVTLDSKTGTFTTDDKSFTLTATVKPETATNSTLSWSSSNLAVATVNNGVVSIKGEGDATISVATTNGKIATYHLIVKDSYVFQEREIVKRNEITGYYIVIYKNGVDVTKDVTVISSPISVRQNRRNRFEISINQHKMLGDQLSILYLGNKQNVTRAK